MYEKSKELDLCLEIIGINVSFERNESLYEENEDLYDRLNLMNAIINFAYYKDVNDEDVKCFLNENNLNEFNELTRDLNLDLLNELHEKLRVDK